MRRFKSARHAQRFLSSHGPITNLFRLCRHGLKAEHYRLLRGRAFAEWREVTCSQNAVGQPNPSVHHEAVFYSAAQVDNTALSPGTLLAPRLGM